MKIRSSRVLAAVGIMVIAGAASVCAATNANMTLPGTEQSIKEARVFEDFTLVSLKRVFFDARRSEIGAEDAAALSRMLKQLRANNQTVIELRGYADGAESAEQGLTLGSQRVESIALFLAEHGVAPSRIRIMAFQEIEDVGPISNPERRRVDVRVFVPSASEAHAQVAAAKNAAK